MAASLRQFADASYSKLNNGTWGARSRKPVAAGDKIIVTKADGSRQEETVERVIWTDNREAWLCALVGHKAPTTRRSRSSGGGSAPNVPGYSRVCTGRPGCTCYDCE